MRYGLRRFLIGEDAAVAKKAEIKRYPLNMRTTKEVREKLERAASESGRSLAQEVEFRLERSFEREALVGEIRQNVRDDVSDSLRRQMPLWEERFVKTLASEWSKTLTMPEFSEWSAKKAKRGRREVSGEVSPSGTSWVRLGKESDWKQVRSKILQLWGELTDDDLLTIEDGRVELVRKIQERYGIAKDEAEEQVHRSEIYRDMSRAGLIQKSGSRRAKP